MPEYDEHDSETGDARMLQLLRANAARILGTNGNRRQSKRTFWKVPYELSDDGLSVLPRFPECALYVNHACHFSGDDFPIFSLNFRPSITVTHEPGNKMGVARKIPDTEWDQYKDVFCNLYKDHALNEVVAKAAKDYEFHASKAQFIRKFRNWGIEKNLTCDRWKIVAKRVRKRKAQGKDSEVSIKHQRISDKKLRKELSRYAVHEGNEDCSSPNNEYRSDIDIWTPQAEKSVVIDFDHIPWFKFQALIEPYFTRFRAKEANARATARGFPLKQRSQDYDMLPESRSSPTSEPCGGPESQAQPCLGVRDPLPSDNQVSDHRVPIEPDRVSPKQKYSGGEMLSLFAECVGAHFTSYGTSDYREIISSHLNEFLVERHDGELRNEVERLHLASSSEITFQLIRYCIYLSSNNLLSNKAIDGIATFLERSREQTALRTLLSLKTPSVMIFGSQLLVSVARLGHIDTARTLLDEGVNVSAVSGTDSRTSALREAVLSSSLSMITLLLNRGAGSIQSREFLHDALRGSDISEVVTSLVEKGAHVHERDQEDTTILTAAAGHCSFTLLRTFLDAGAHVNESTNSPTALQAAATNFDVHVTQTLYTAGADINAPISTTRNHHMNVRQQNEGYPSNEHFASSLQQASFVGNTEAVRTLVREDATIDACPWVERSSKWPAADDSWKDALEAAVSCSDEVLVRILLEAGADVNGRGARNTPLQMAACQDDVDMVDMLLEYGAEVHAPSRAINGRTALQGAAERGNYSLVKRFLSLGADVNAPASPFNGRTALQAAVEQDFPEVIRLLIESGADVNANESQEEGLTCLEAAIQGKRVELVLLLLDKGADVNGPADIFQGQVPLQAAVQSLCKRWYGHLSTSPCEEWSIFQALLDAGADVNTTLYSNRGLSALEAAVRCGHKDIVQILLHRGANPDYHSRHTTPLIQAARFGSPEMLHLVLAAGADLNKYIPCNDLESPLEISRCGLDHTLRSPLQAAALKGSLLNAEVLLDAGAQCRAGSSDLHFPDALRNACYNTTEMMRLLLAKGADPNAVDNTYCDSALGIVLSTKYLKSRADKACLLIQAGADVKGTKPGRRHLLSLAARSPDDALTRSFYKAAKIDVTRSLLEAGACINPFLEADSQILPELLDPEIRGPPTQDPEIFRLLIGAGADVNARSSRPSRATVLQLAANTCSLELVELLLSYGAEVNAPPHPFGGMTALQAAVRRGNLKLVLVLLCAGAKITAPGAKVGGRTALEAAAEYGRLDILSLLLRNYDAPETIEHDCKEAKNFAFKERHYLIGEFLTDYRRGHDLTGEVW